MRTSILALALGVALASPVGAYASESPNLIKAIADFFSGSDHGQRADHKTATSHDPFKPRRTDGLSSNRDACASYGCVGAGGGGD
jgi:hypothetical protein